MQKDYGERSRSFAHDLIKRNLDHSSEGRDPRELPKPLLEQAFERHSLLKSIREKCLDCCCYQVGEIGKCVSIGCALWPLRMGSNPLSNRKGFPASLRNKSSKLKEQIPDSPEGSNTTKTRVAVPPLMPKQTTK
jgi:hypothetical protein